MYSNLVPFSSMIESIKDETHMTILKNDYPRIRRLIYRAEKDIGYGGTVILKKIPYSVAAGSIIVDGSISRIKLPSDIVRLESVGMCHEGICPGDYIIQGNYLFFGEKIVDSFNLIYYTLLSDGKGNPVVTENHAEAVSAAVSYWLYKGMRFQGKGHAQHFQYLENFYHDRISEARGDDVMPDSMEEWAKIAQVLQMSSRDVMIYLSGERCFKNLPEGLNPDDMVISEQPIDPADPSDTSIWSFQFNNLTDDISSNAIVTEAWLGANGVLHSESALLSGKFITYPYTGRIGFAIKAAADRYLFTDVLMNVLNDAIFDKYYDAAKGLDIYISKEYYDQSAVYYKFILNS